MLHLVLTLQLLSPQLSPPVRLLPEAPRLVLASLEQPGVDLTLPAAGDPYQGTYRMAEVGAGAGAVLLVDGLSTVMVGLGAIGALSSLFGGNTSDGLVAVLILGGVAGYLVGTPIAAGLGAWLVRSDGASGDLGRAIGYAFLARGAKMLLDLTAIVILSSLDASTAGSIYVLTSGVADLLWIPWAASLGLHDGAERGRLAVPARELLPPPQNTPPPQVMPPPPVVRVSFAF